MNGNKNTPLLILIIVIYLVLWAIMISCFNIENYLEEIMKSIIALEYK